MDFESLLSFITEPVFHMFDFAVDLSCTTKKINIWIEWGKNGVQFLVLLTSWISGDVIFLEKKIVLIFWEGVLFLKGKILIILILFIKWKKKKNYKNLIFHDPLDYFFFPLVFEPVLDFLHFLTHLIGQPLYFLSGGVAILEKNQ